MAYDEGWAEQMRDDIGDLDGLGEKRMFGGLCFLHHGHMICGVFRDGGLYRVGKENVAAARSLPGVDFMEMSGRRMGGFVVADGDAMCDEEVRLGLLEMALWFVATLPPK